MRYFFSKHFEVFDLGRVDYLRCEDCGFVLSQTHAQMAPAQWERINHLHHASYQGTDLDAGDPRWLERMERQAAVIDDAQQLGLIRAGGAWLDYACGDGKLAAMLRAQYGQNLLCHDPYMPAQPGYLDASQLTPGRFDFVVTTSVFEHLWRREQFDNIHALVAPHSVLGLHTLVCEAVPEDPSWFYLAPVHCAFHTNRSMDILFRQWGYTCSVYQVEARLWLWFRGDPGAVEARVSVANTRSAGIRYEFARGFVAYWKHSPLRRTG